jgi:hypothetical protein
MRDADRTAVRLPSESYALLVRTICEQEGRRR